MLAGMRVGDERCPVPGKRGTEIGALPSGKPELIGTDGMVGLANHFKLEVGDDGGEQKGWVLQKISIALAAGCFTAEAAKNDGATGALRERAERARQFEDGGGAAGIVVGPVVDDFPS